MIGVSCWGRAVPGVLAVLTGAPLWAEGTQTGVIAGVVRDAEDAALQGVEIRLVGPQIQRTALTEAGGRFRFPALGVGSYEVSAELLGLSARRRDVAVYVDKTTELELTLTEAEEAVVVPDIEEWIQVLAEAPVIDRFDTSVGANVSFELLNELPVKRFYQSVATLLPGVAGGEDGNPNTAGSLRSGNLYLIDGVDTTDATTGLFGLNLSYEAVQEVEVTTAAPSAAYGRASGAVINVVTRSGSNRFRGIGRWVATNNDWNDAWDFPGEQTAHLSDELAAANAGPDDLDPTLALSLGGPLIRDHLWFFTAFENVERSFLRPTVTGSLWNEGSEVQSSALKLSWQPTDHHTLVAQHTADDARISAFQPFDDEPLENRLPETPAALINPEVERLPGDLFALEEQSQDGRFTKLQWNAAFTQNLSLAFSLAQQERELARAPAGSRGVTADAPHVALVFEPTADPGRPIERFVLFNGVTQEGAANRPRDQANVSIEAFLQTGALSHELEAGVDYQSTESELGLEFAGAAGFDPATGIPVGGQLFLDADFSDECVFLGRCVPFNPNTGAFDPFLFFNFWQRPARRTEEQTTAIYVTDTLSADRWLVSLGVRYEAARGDDDEGRRLVDDDVIAPRISVSFSPLGRDGGYLLSASYGRFFEPFLQQYLDAYARAEPFTGWTQYVWDQVPGRDCSGADPANLLSPCWTPSELQGFEPVLGAPPNASLARASVDELVFGFERQLTPLTGLSLHVVDRRWRDLWDDVLFVIGDGEDIGVEVRNLDQAKREYRAVQALLQKRFSDGWQLLASYTWSETEGNLFTDDGQDSFADFADVTDVNVINRFGPGPYDRPHQVVLSANYQKPFGRSVLSLASVVQYRDGVPFQQEKFDPQAGIRFLTPRGSQRLPGVFQWDFAASYDLRLAPAFELELKGEVFNLTGESQQLGAESLLDTGLQGRPRTLGDLQVPRSFRFTVGLRF